MIILGIDPGSRYTGYAVLEVGEGEERVLALGVADVHKLANHQLRLRELYRQLTKIVEATCPDVCAVEMPVYGRNPQSMLKLGRAQATAMLVALNREVPVAEYTPSVIKKAVTGSGNATKDQVGYMVRAMVTLGPEHDDARHDALDALAVALCHAQRSVPGAGRFGARGAAQLQQQTHHDVGPSMRTKSGSHSDWASFVAANPDRVSK